MKNLIYLTGKALIIAIIVLATGITSIFAQNGDKNYVSYKGKIQDSESKKPVIFATISTVGASIGTVTNNEGEFILKIKNGVNVSAIEISHIGYKTAKINLSNLKAEGNIIKLELSSVPLKEVTIIPYNPKEMIQVMMDKVEENYGTKPNMMKGFYREAIKKRSNYIFISEAIIDLYKASYTNTYDDDMVKVFKGRKSIRIKASDTIMVKLQGGPKVSLLMDIIKNPYVLFEKENMEKYDMKFGETRIIDDKPIFVIEFWQKEKNIYPLYNGKLYINSKTFALTAAEFSLNLEDIDEATKLFISKKPAGLKFVPLSTNYYVKYKEENNKYYFTYARYELNFTCDWKRKLFKSKYNVMAEFAITDRDTVNVHKFPRKERLYQHEVFADKVNAFTDSDFWGENNYIEPDKSIEEALAKYAKWLKKNSK